MISAEIGLLVIATAFCVCLSLWTRSGCVKYNLPPGPSGLPIIGNMHQMYRETAPLFVTLGRLSKRYGPYVSFKMGKQVVISIHDDGTAVRDLLDNKSAIYSNRPANVIREKLTSQYYLLGERNHAKWRISRRLITQYFSPKISQSKHVHIQEAESTQLLMDLHSHPEKTFEHVLRYTSSVLNCIAYGSRVATTSHPMVSGLVDIMIRRGEAYQAAPPVEIAPYLDFLPSWFFKWKTIARSTLRAADTLFRVQAERARDRAQLGLNADSFASKLYQLQGAQKLEDSHLHYLCGIVLEGGTDPLSIAIQTCLLALTANPEIQKRAQQEIDLVCDEVTMPGWDDRHSLPYIGMIIRETLRWRPPFPIGVPHSLDEDDTWGKFSIPKGATIFTNIWGIHMNPERYTDPETFNPDRFENHTRPMAESMRNPDPRQRDHFAFGAGKRACPGVQLSEQALFITIARILWAFDLSSPNGEAVDTHYDTAFTGYAVRRPKPFALVTTPRSRCRVETTEAAHQQAQERVFSQFG